MTGPRLERGDDFDDDVGNVDPDLVFGRRLNSRFGTPIRAGGGAWRSGSGQPGAPRAGEAFRPTRDLDARREAYDSGARSGSLDVPRGREDSPGARSGAPGVPGGAPGGPSGSLGGPGGLRGSGGSGGGSSGPGALPPRNSSFQPSVPLRPAPASRPRIPGERQFRDGDRVRHPRLGAGIVVTSKLTRNDEEVTVAFSNGGGIKTLLASIANLEWIG
jgi:hypothetical protein